MSSDEFKPLNFAPTIIKRLHVRRLSAGNREQLVSYDRQTGLYVLTDRPIELEAQQRFGKAVRDYHVAEIVSAVRRNAPPIEPHNLNNPTHRIVVFRNGVLDLTTLRLRQHSSQRFYTIGLPHNWSRHALCREFDHFVEQVLPRESHRLLGQILGYLLIPSTEFRKFFVFLGSGANGKSTLIEAIVAMLGRNNVSHQSLHSLADGRFAAAELFGKLANTYADLDSQDLQSSGLLKQLTSGDSLQFEKKHRDPFTAAVTARLLFSANRMPPIRDTSEAIADRLVLLEFPHRFDEHEQDRRLIQRLTTSAEIEGVIAKWAVPGLQSLLAADQFDVPDRSRQLLACYRRQSDPFVEFAERHIQVNQSGWVSKSELYAQYKSWCHEQGILRESTLRDFNLRVSQHFGIADDDRRAPGSRDRVWQGIRLRQSRQSQAGPSLIPGQVGENIGQSQESQNYPTN